MKVSPNNAYINRNGAIAILMGMLNVEGEHFVESHPRENHRQLMTAGREELASSRNEFPYWLFSAEWSAFKRYTLATKTDSAGCVYTYLCIHVHIYMYALTIIIKEEKVIHLRVLEAWEGLEGGKEAERDIILFQLKRIKNK